jgi:hypothetical protein
MIRQPHTIEIPPIASHEVSETADQRPMVKPGSPYVQVNCTFGRNYTYQDVMGELYRLRANRGVHSITFEPMAGKRYLTINAYMGEASETHVGYDGCVIIDSSVTIPFVQADTPTFLIPIRFRLRGILSILSPWTLQIAQAAGRIFDIDGYIRDLGAGGGQTRIQIHNETAAIDYLSTPGDFVCAPGAYRLQNAVLGANLDYAQGDEIDCNIIDIPLGGLSADALVTIWTWSYRP